MTYTPGGKTEAPGQKGPEGSKEGLSLEEGFQCFPLPGPRGSTGRWNAVKASLCSIRYEAKRIKK